MKSLLLKPPIRSDLFSGFHPTVEGLIFISEPQPTNNRPMEPWEIVDDYFCSVCDMPETELNPDSQFLIHVWHSFGLIQNNGFHAYLCAVGEGSLAVADAYRRVGIGKGSELILSALDLWRSYRSERVPGYLDPDEFRNKFGSQLDGIERDFHDLEDDMISCLAVIVGKKNETRR